MGGKDKNTQDAQVVASWLQDDGMIGREPIIFVRLIYPHFH